MQTIVLTFHIPWKMVDAASTMSETVTIPAGQYVFERIENPLLPNGRPWLVMQGTKIGANECFFHRMDRKDFGAFRIRFEDGGSHGGPGYVNGAHRKTAGNANADVPCAATAITPIV